MTIEDPQTLLAQARALPEKSRVATALLARSARLADTLADPETGFRARLTLIRRCFDTGEWSYIMPAFGWCVAQHDRDPDTYPFDDIAGYSKWVIGQAIDTPSVPPSMVMALIDDAERRYDAAGYSVRPIHLLRGSAHNTFGDPEAALGSHRRFEATRRDRYSDCFACEASSEAAVLRTAGDHNGSVLRLLKALRMRLSCHTQPARILASLAWWTADSPQGKAPAWAQESERHLLTYEGFFSSKAELFSYFATAGEWAKVWRMVERQLPHVLEEHRPMASMEWYAAAVDAAWRHLSTDADPPALVIAGVEGLEGDVSLEDLIAWLTPKRDRLFAAFDQRAGNRFFTDVLRAQWPAEARAVGAT